MVGGSPLAWWSRSVPRVINPRASAMVCATTGRPGVVEARWQQDALARSDRLLQKGIEREIGPQWPVPSGLKTALKNRNSRLLWGRAFEKLVMASSAVSTRSSMGKLATGTGSGLQGTENLWAAVEGLADMVRELKDNEKVENLEGAVKDLAVTISELDGNVRR